MNSRERVQAAINFKQPDRTPIDLGGIRASGINAILYDRLKKKLGIQTPTKVHGAMEILAEVEPEILERFHVDVVPVDATLCLWDEMEYSKGVKHQLYGGADVWFPPETNITLEADGSHLMRDAKGVAFACMPKKGFYFDFIESSMAAGTIDPAKFNPSPKVDEKVLEAFSRRTKFLYESTDKSLLGWGSGISFMGLSFLLSDNITQGHLDEWLVTLMTEKDMANDMMGRSVDAAIERTKLFYQAAGDRIDVWGVASDDAGTQRAGLIGGDLFAEMIAPHYRRLCDWVHTHTRWKTFLHSCGSIHDYIEPWIGAGIDIINPVQISAANMEPERLMREFGGRVVFWGGGCDTQKVLPLGTPEEVRAHVRENLRIFTGRPGGYVFNQVHNIQPNVPMDNVLALFEAGWEYGDKRP